jgi:glutathione peroxidase
MLTDFKIKDIKGNEIDFNQYQGKVVLLVNVASKCGLTPQYAQLEELYQKYKDKGFEIIGFPCNQFGGQEPGTPEEIVQFCESKYNVSFTLTEKINVKGTDVHPLFNWLASQTSDPSTCMSWNFVKFLINKNGKFEGRYAPKQEASSLDAKILQLVQ